jgi:AraC-like DNA-binding protein
MLLLIIGIVLYYKRKQAQNNTYFQRIIEELELKNTKKSPSKKLNISPENIEKIVEGLKVFEKNQLFLKKNCSLNYVANKINTNSTYLSKVIQIHKQKKFIQYITDLRIDYALERLKNDRKFRAYNIKSIAAELGYNSPESFSKDFKRRTKLYPSYYIKKINETVS